MKVILTAIGTPGDVFPLLGLGIELKARQHDVVLITHGHFESHALRAGLKFVAVGTEEEYLGCLAGNTRIWDPRDGYSEVVKCATALIPAMYEAIQSNIDPGRTVIAAHYLDFASRLAQETEGVPVATIVVPPLGFGFAEKYLSESALAPPLDFLLGALGPGWNFSPVLTIGLFPAWFARPEPNWPANVRLTGFPLFDFAEAVPPDVDEFLDGGPPPVVFTAGPRVELSSNGQSETFLKMVVEACHRIGRRGLVLAGFREGRPELPANIHIAKFAPLTRILPRCGAIVHHAGIGTTAAAMLCGIPQFATPLCHDQVDNAQRMKQLGVGDWLSPNQIDGPVLATKLSYLFSSLQIARRCKEMSGRCIRENGIAAACDLIEAVRQSPTGKGVAAAGAMAIAGMAARDCT